MSNKPTKQATQASLPGAETMSAEQQQAAERAEAERQAAERAEAERQAAEVPVALLRTEYIDGMRYPAGGLLLIAGPRVEPLRQDGAVDPHPDAVAAARDRGAPVWSHAAELAKRAELDAPSA